MKRSLKYVGGLGLLACLGLLCWQLLASRPLVGSGSKGVLRNSSFDRKASNSAVVRGEGANRKALPQLLSSEAFRMSKIDEDPKTTDAGLDDIAHSLDPSDMKYLQQRSLDTSAPEDERFLASDLLARNGDLASVPYLKHIVASPFEDHADIESTRGSIEWLVRARAVEGFENFADNNIPADKREELIKSLTQMHGRIQQSFLGDRLAATIHVLQATGSDDAQRSSKQDEEKLGEMLDKNNAR